MQCAPYNYCNMYIGENKISRSNLRVYVTQSYENLIWPTIKRRQSPKSKHTYTLTCLDPLQTFHLVSRLDLHRGICRPLPTQWMSCTAVVLVAVESRGEGSTWDLRAPFSNQAAALRTRHPRIWRHVRQRPGDFSYPSTVNFPGQRSPRTSSGHAAGSRLLHAAQCCEKKLLENDRKKSVGSNDRRRVPGGKEI